MKTWTGIGSIVLLIMVSQPVWSQTSLLDSEVYFREQSVTIHFMLEAMEAAGAFTFSYGRDVPVERTFHVQQGKRSIREYLDDMFKNDSLKYIEKGRKILIVPASHVSTEIPKQTVRGQVLDLDTKLPMAGVNVILGSESPQRGSITDQNGYFRFDDVPVGRHDLLCSSIGYETREVSNFQLTSGKEYVANVELEESVYAINEVEITSRKERSLPNNELAVVSGRSFSAYEVENYPGAISDISRAAVSYPGVVSPNDGQNHIVIRGNSPKGLQWRMEGIEIPNLNHFSNIGASGGGINVVSNNMLGGSDFLTGAFPSEYGNALSGVFDLRLRSGNNEKHEQTLQIGMLGTEAMVEGLSLAPGAVVWEDAIYEASLTDLLQVMQAQPDSLDCIWLVGHNPGFSYLVEALAGNGIGNIPTCGAVLLELAVNAWAAAVPGTARVVWFDYPKNDGPPVQF